MEKNHDANKQQSNEQIRKSSRIAMFIAVLILIGQISSFVLKLIAAAHVPKELDNQSMLGYLTYISYRPIPLLILKNLLRDNDPADPDPQGYQQKRPSLYRNQRAPADDCRHFDCRSHAGASRLLARAVDLLRRLFRSGNL